MSRYYHVEENKLSVQCNNLVIAVIAGRALSAIMVLYASLYIVGQCSNYDKGHNFVVEAGFYANTTQVVAIYLTPFSKVTPRCSWVQKGGKRHNLPASGFTFIS